jgi:predicted MFS family arabinose efflux permease
VSAAFGGLWRNRQFSLFWVGETTSKLGTSVSTLALPLVAVLVLHATTLEVGVLTSVAWLPWLLIGLSAGAWVDRLPLRPLMVACDLVTVVLLASVPVAAWLGVLSYLQLLAVAVLTGVAALFFSTAYQVLLPELLPERDLDEANAKLQGAESAAQIAGPSLAGVLAQAFGAVTGLLADAASCLVSVVCLLPLRVTPRDRPPRPADSRLGREIGEGLRFVFGDPYLRALAIFGATSNIALTGFQSIEVPFLVSTVGLSPGVVGVLLAVIGVGGIIGAALSPWLARRLGSARAIVLTLGVGAVLGLLLPLTGRGFWLIGVVGYLAIETGVVAGNVIIAPFRQRYCPPRLLGRVVATGRVLSYGAIPLGGLLGGVLGTAIGIRPTIWIMVVGLVLSTVALAFGPLGRGRDLPAPMPDPAVAAAPTDE